MNINVRIIPHKEQRYETQGDWWFTPEDNLEIRVTELNSWLYETLIAIHEIIEAVLCKRRGISEARVSEFDMVFEERRLEGKADGEPGDDARAPYRDEHFTAEIVERLLALELGIDWREYQESSP